MESKKLGERFEKEYKDYRPPVKLTERADGTIPELPPYVDLDGVQIHPDRFKDYIIRRNKLFGE